MLVTAPYDEMSVGMRQLNQSRFRRNSRSAGALCRFEPLEGRRLFSTTFYVSPRGNDANAGTDLQHAWRHIQQAMNAATPGSTVIVEPGVYREKLTVNVSGDAVNGFTTFQAKGRVTIDGRGVAGSDIINLNDQNYIQIVGFNIQNDLSVTDGSGIRLNGHDDHITLQGNTIHNITGIRATGISAYGADPINGISNLVIDGNQIYNTQPSPSETLTVNGNVHEFTIQNNYIHDTNNIGIDCVGGEGVSSNPATDFARNGEVSGNKVTRVHFAGNGDGAGIIVDGGQNIVVERNSSWANDVGIEVKAIQAGAVSSGVIIRDNNVFANRGPGISIGDAETAAGTVRNCQVTNNLLFHDETGRGNSDGELRMQIGFNNSFENNVIDANRGMLLIDGQSGSSTNTSNYNLFFAPSGTSNALFAWNGFPYTGLSLFQSGAMQDTNSIFANPLLLNPFSLRPRLSVRSPVVNAGDPNYIVGAGETDFNGKPRVLGSQVDIGPVEIR
jgi:hypothetical protein